LLAKMSFIYPNKPVDITPALRVLPADKTVPFLEEWRWLHTPGHTPGHVSFFRQKDRLLIAGDAIVTVRTDSFYRVLVQKEEVNGPPRYLTTDWNAAKESVSILAALNPAAAVTGHGAAMRGEQLKEGLEILVRDFDKIALPSHGRYVERED
jgi:glyoxylase-like metal-dependent hydrolase (beta-lactamase superfamily II)